MSGTECPAPCPGNLVQQRAASTFNSSSANPNISFNTTLLPILPAKPDIYKPMPYIFRVPYSSVCSSIKGALIKCPSFQVQLDHTIAVIWSLFAKNAVSKEIGLVQLHWALGFLRNLHNVNGEYTKDVKLCIDTIEEESIKLYAEMVDEIAHIPKSKKSRSCCCKKKSSTSKVDSAKTSDNDIENATLQEAYVPKQIPFSINYSDLVRKYPELLLQNEKSSRVKSLVGTNVQMDAQGAEMLEFLNNWRDEQVKKIETELKRLNSIENFIAQRNKTLNTNKG